VKTGKFLVDCAFIAFLAVSLSGCSLMVSAVREAVRNTPHDITGDPDLPVEATAVVRINYEIHVKEYNGINVQDVWYSDKSVKTINAPIPGGETRLVFDIDKVFERRNSTYTFNRKNIELKYNFEAGKKYMVGIYSEDIGNFFTSRRKVFLGIWDDDPASESYKTLLRFWEIAEIPF